MTRHQKVSLVFHSEEQNLTFQSIFQCPSIVLEESEMHLIIRKVQTVITQFNSLNE